MNKRKVLINTDIGGDIDDALALAYLLEQSNCEILGITTVNGYPIERAQIVSAICKVARKDIPIYPGLDPKAPNGWYCTPEGKRELVKWEHEKNFETDKAIDFLYETLKKYPNEVDLIDLGSFSNTAALLTKYSDSAELIKELHVMAGVFDEKINNSDKMPFANWNVWADPISAEIMFHSKIKSIKVYGLEITSQLTMSKEKLETTFTTPLLKCVIDFGSFWLEDHIATFHDPLVATCVFNENICEYKRGFVKIDLKTKNEKQYAMTTFEKTNKGNCLLATNINKKEFFREYIDVVKIA